MTADDCTFCGIVADPARAATFYEDDAAIGILDLRQPGWPDAVHALVIPRPHVEVLDKLDDETASGLMRAAVQVARIVRAAVSPEGYNLWQSNGAAGGQEVPHVHLHVISRRTGDGLLRIYPTAPKLPAPGDLAAVAERLRAVTPEVRAAGPKGRQ